jgi:hypothetical protein
MAMMCSSKAAAEITWSRPSKELAARRMIILALPGHPGLLCLIAGTRAGAGAGCSVHERPSSAGGAGWSGPGVAHVICSPPASSASYSDHLIT